MEHKISYNKPLELSNYLKSKNRIFDVTIFAKSKGNRDDVTSFLSELNGLSIDTEDGRRNFINRIECTNINTPSEKTVSLKTKYSYISFDGNSSYGTINSTPFLGGSTIIFDLDINIKSQNTSGDNNHYILDTYREYDDFGSPKKSGIKVCYNNFDGKLYITAGLTTTDFVVSTPFSSNINNRNQLTIAIGLSATRVTIRAYLNNVLIINSSAFWFFGIPKISKQLTIGAYEYDESFGLYSNFCKLDLYSMRVSTASSTNYGKNGEFLNRNINSDFIYMPCNEGFGNFCYNNLPLSKENQVDITYMELFGDFSWILYLEETKNGYNYYPSLVKFYVSGNTTIK